MRSGSDLVPVFSFGENDIFEQLANERGTKIYVLQKKFQAVFGFTLRMSPPHTTPLLTALLSSSLLWSRSLQLSVRAFEEMSSADSSCAQTTLVSCRIAIRSYQLVRTSYSLTDTV